jgi:hypothetical protein
MSRRKVMAVMFSLIVLSMAVSALAQQAAPAAAQAPRPVPQRPPLFFREDWQQTPANDEHPLTQQSVGNPNLELKTYGTTAKELLITGTKDNPQNPTHVWTGMCTTNCLLTLRDKNNMVDLTGQAKVRWVTKVSGFQRIHPVVKLADGTFLVGDYAGGSTVDWREEEFFFSEIKWVKLDEKRVVATGAPLAAEKVDLSKVEEFGWTDLMPASGHGQGGWSDVGKIELYGKSVPRTGSTSAASKN